MGYGGALIWTGLTRNLKEKFPAKKIIVIYSFPVKEELKGNKPPDYVIYRNNPDIFLLINRNFWKYLKYLFSKKRFLPINLDRKEAYYWDADRSSLEKMMFKTGKHSIGIACEAYGIKEAVLLPRLVLTEREKRRSQKTLKDMGLLSTKYLCVEPNVKNVFGVNKAWFEDRWQLLIDKINQYIQEKHLNLSIVQLGVTSGKKYDGVISLQGMTTFREAGNILKNSIGLISCEGGLVHLSVSMGVKNIVLCSSWVPEELFKYANDVFLYADIECKNCGLRTACPRERECMKRISVDCVYRAVLNLIR